MNCVTRSTRHRTEGSVTNGSVGDKTVKKDAANQTGGHEAISYSPHTENLYAKMVLLQGEWLRKRLRKLVLNRECAQTKINSRDKRICTR